MYTYDAKNVLTWVGRVSERLQKAIASQKSGNWISALTPLETLHQSLSLWVDLGWLVEVEELVDSTLKLDHFEKRVGMGDPLIKSQVHAYFVLFKAHLHSVRQQNLQKCAEVFGQYVGTSHIFLSSWAKSGAGLVLAFQNRLSEANAQFLEAAQMQLELGMPLDAAKVMIRYLVFNRKGHQLQDASQYCSKINQWLQPLGLESLSAQMILRGIEGNIAMESGATALALRQLKEAAKMANALPPSPSGGFALFQYAQALEKSNRWADSLKWLDHAAQKQRVINPLGLLGLQMVKARTLDSMGDEVQALCLSKEIMYHKGITTEFADALDFLVWWDELVTRWQRFSWKVQVLNHLKNQHPAFSEWSSFAELRNSWEKIEGLDTRETEPSRSTFCVQFGNVIRLSVGPGDFRWARDQNLKLSTFKNSCVESHFLKEQLKNFSLGHLLDCGLELDFSFFPMEELGVKKDSCRRRRDRFIKDLFELGVFQREVCKKKALILKKEVRFMLCENNEKGEKT
jgi:tetratricopeptide (TPR) repeat protein